MSAQSTLADKQNKVPKLEIFGHAIGGVGQNLIYAMWSTFITAFYTDVFKMNPVFMGGLFFVARIWDGVNDPVMGMIADRSKSKFGRYRCWLVRMPALVAVCLVLMFTVPNFGTVGNMVYAAITYILMDMAFTGVDIPYWSLPAAMTSDPEERTKIFTACTMSTNIANILGSMLIPVMLTSFGGQKGEGAARAYFVTAVIIALVGASLYLVCFSLVRERVKAPSETFSLKLAVKSLVTNKPLFCVMVSNLFINFAFIVKMNFNYFYCSYNLGNFMLMSIMGLLTVPCMLVGSLSAPFLAKKFGKKNTIIGTILFNLAVSMVFFLIGYSNVMLVMVISSLQILCVGVTTVLINSMTADTIEYGEWMTGQRNDGIITSTRTLIVKVAMAVSGVAVGAVLAISNYNPDVAPSVATMDAFHLIVSLLPGIVMFIGIIPMFFYKLSEKRHAEIVEEIAARHAAEQGKNEE